MRYLVFSIISNAAILACQSGSGGSSGKDTGGDAGGDAVSGETASDDGEVDTATSQERVEDTAIGASSDITSETAYETESEIDTSPSTASESEPAIETDTDTGDSPDTDTVADTTPDQMTDSGSEVDTQTVVEMDSATATDSGTDGGTDGLADSGSHPVSMCPESCEAAMERYCVCDDSEEYREASEQCASAGLQLVRIDSEEENALIRDMADNYELGYIWLGGRRSDDIWSWRNGDAFWQGDENGTAVDGRYTNWGTGNPGDSRDKTCMRMFNNGTWDDTECNDDDMEFVCELR